ncbi:hypothetical protein ISS07_04445 [Candidatus Woesearchaeota archaeon]|nr:hypothetical protein [Candidatus Woesearchaeota archaeon]
MRKTIKKVFLLGLGAASMTKKQAEKTVKDLVKSNNVTIREGREILGRVKKHAVNESENTAENKIQEKVRKDVKFASKITGRSIDEIDGEPNKIIGAVVIFIVLGLAFFAYVKIFKK